MMVHAWKKQSHQKGVCQMGKEGLIYKCRDGRGRELSKEMATEESEESK